MDQSIALAMSNQKKDLIAEAVSAKYMPSYKRTKKIREIISGGSKDLLDNLNIVGKVAFHIKEGNRLSKENKRIEEEIRQTEKASQTFNKAS
ncbi:MAG: hypothetical protein CO170_02855 [candidate division SR1 bacterium CG_4_9_14_3_um_filter_40_9]|nr:MAG: hypothetical protein CO170_02855 [candidate division SR1 bacterium CG_4_9_14_3_um_filter_40_9]